MGRAALAAAFLILVAAAAGFWLLTPRQHVAAGCLWWTATTVDRVGPGQDGCVRGYFTTGGGLAESADPDAQRLSLAEPPGRSCGFTAGDAVVVRYRAVFDDGRTVIQVEDCR